MRYLLMLVVFSVKMAALSGDPSFAAAAEPAGAVGDVEFFERKIRPLLSKHCYSCHSSAAKIVHGGLRLDSAAGVKRGGDSGPLLVRGKPAESLLAEAVHYNGDLQMPPKGKLPERDIKNLVDWIDRGAAFPADEKHVETVDGAIDFEAGRRFWSFQAFKEHALPSVKLADWPQSRIDSFVLSGMEQHGLAPADRATKAVLIRRVFLDLTGLPPTPEQVRAFVEDSSPTAFARVVEKRLASPHYGEKWARTWLDLSRYTDRTASWISQNGAAHLYRDWVVRAFNDDMPYDDFVRRQLATDLMPATGPEDLAALGFVGLSPSYWKELKLPSEIIKVIVADEWEERVHAVSSTFLGLTVACARCHDHKFDPISAEDYYAMAGVFASSRLRERPLVADRFYEPVRKAKTEIAKIEAELKKLRAEIAKRNKAKTPTATPGKPAVQQPAVEDTADTLEARVARGMARIAELKAIPHFDAPLANAVTEESLFVERAGKNPQDGTRLDYRAGPQDLPLFVRGDPNRPGKLVRRRFLTVLARKPTPFQQGSGRLELAQAIVTDAAPLTARVIVNRIWLAHFGRGLVDTPSNFGVQGSRPTHPELLDDLAARFVANGWSMKWLHREILSSATWQQSSQGSEQSTERDPANSWLSHMNRRRLDFEAWRDSMLAVTGVLDRKTGGPSIALDHATNHRRTLYGTIHRRDLSTTLQIHDFPDPNQHSPQRSSTTTALQGLFALNSPLVSQQAQAFVKRLQTERPDNPSAQIDLAYWLLYSRGPTAKERATGLAFLGSKAAPDAAARRQQYAHVLLVSNEFLFVD